MSVHNAASTLEAALRSILWQTFSDWELLVVNDASTDASAQILRQIDDPRIRVIDEGRRKGLAARLNQCIEQGRGQYLARMDADDVAYPERFERQVRYLDAHPDVDLLGHGAVLFKGDGRIIGLYPRAQTHEEICRSPYWGFPLAHPTWMGKRSWFVRHRYDERLTKGQDQDLLLRTWQGSRFAALPEILLGYRMEKISVAKSASGRWAYCCRLTEQVRDRSSAVRAVKGMTVHGMALARDLILDLGGIMNRQTRRSFDAADESITHQWQTVWARLGGGRVCPEQGHG